MMKKMRMKGLILIVIMMMPDNDRCAWEMMTVLNVILKKWIIFCHDGSYLVVSRGGDWSLSWEMMTIFKSYAEEVDDGSYLVVSRGGDQAPRSLSVRNDEDIESYAEEVDDED